MQLTLEELFAQAAAKPTVTITFTFKNVGSGWEAKDSNGTITKFEINVEDSANAIYDAWLDLAFLDASPVPKYDNIGKRYAYIIQKLENVRIYREDDTFVEYDKVTTKHDPKLDKHSQHNLQAWMKWGNGFKKSKAFGGYYADRFKSSKSTTGAIKKINKAVRSRAIQLGALPMMTTNRKYTLIEVGETFVATDRGVFSGSKSAKPYKLLTAPVVHVRVGSKASSLGKLPINDSSLSYEVSDEDGKVIPSHSWDWDFSRRVVVD